MKGLHKLPQKSHKSSYTPLHVVKKLSPCDNNIHYNLRTQRDNLSVCIKTVLTKNFITRLSFEDVY